MLVKYLRDIYVTEWHITANIVLIGINVRRSGIPLNSLIFGWFFFIMIYFLALTFKLLIPYKNFTHKSFSIVSFENFVQVTLKPSSSIDVCKLYGIICTFFQL